MAPSGLEGSSIVSEVFLTYGLRPHKQHLWGSGSSEVACHSLACSDPECVQWASSGLV